MNFFSLVFLASMATTIVAQTTFRLEAKTGDDDAGSSYTSGDVSVAFVINDVLSDPQLFFAASDIGEVQELTFDLSGAPSSIQFSISGTDAWGVDEVTAWVDNGAPMILMCTGDGITTPAAGDNGHWIDNNNANIPAILDVAVAADDTCDYLTTNEDTTVAVVATTVAAEDTTVAAEDTTVAAEDTTVAAEDTTVAVVDTTVAAEDTTVAAEDTTVAAEDTTVAAEDTTVAAEDTTVAAEDTTVAAEDTTAAVVAENATAAVVAENTTSSAVAAENTTSSAVSAEDTTSSAVAAEDTTSSAAAAALSVASNKYISSGAAVASLVALIVRAY